MSTYFDAGPKQQSEAVRDGIVPADYPKPVAADYPKCYEIVEKRVYPVRKDVNREAHRKYWWHYGDKRPALYSAMTNLSRVLTIAEVSKYIAPVFVQTGIVFSHMTIVFPSEQSADFMLLQSSIHECWARYRSSSMGATLRYVPSDIVRTMPFPDVPIGTTEVGDSYHELRRQIMIENQEGLTSTYNRFHDPAAEQRSIAQLRGLQAELDLAVMSAYGWTDLEFNHKFRNTQQGTRYTISELARREVLRRLLELNHARHAEELLTAQDKQGDAGGKSSTPKQPKTNREQLSLL